MSPTIQELSSKGWTVEMQEHKELLTEVRARLLHLEDLMVNIPLFPVVRGHGRNYRYNSTQDRASGVVQYETEVPEKRATKYIKAWLESKDVCIDGTGEISSRIHLVSQALAGGTPSDTMYLVGEEVISATLLASAGDNSRLVALAGMNSTKFHSYNLTEQLVLINDVIEILENVAIARPPRSHNPTGVLAVSSYVSLDTGNPT